MSFYIHFQLILLVLPVLNGQVIPSYDKLCASESTHLSVDGTYSNPKWDAELNGAIYYNAKASQYLFPYIGSGGYRYLMINHDPIFTEQTTLGSLTCFCDIGIKTNDYVFNIDDCFNKWQYSTNGNIIDTNMTIVNCNDIRITGNDHLVLNGIYVWKMFIDIYSVYYCKECDFGNNTYDGTYLYGWIYSNGNYNWRLGSDYSVPTAWAGCYLGNNLGSSYLFNLEDCSEWQQYNSTSETWYIDQDMVVKKRIPCETNINNEHCLSVHMYPSATLPTSNTVPIQSNHDNLNTYFYIFFIAHGMHCIDPTITFTFETIDYDNSYEYIHVINNNGTLISQCGGAMSNSCGAFEHCFNDISIGVNKITMNETYQILVTESAHVNALCTSSHNYSINAELTLKCSVLISTTEPSINPTTYPSFNPTTYAYNPTTQLPSNTVLVSSMHMTNVNKIFYYVAGSIICLFFTVESISILDAKCFRQNDHFRWTSIIKALIQILDMTSDIFFVIVVYYCGNVTLNRYTLTTNNDENRIQFLLIFILSITFIILPAIISLFQLHTAISKYWMQDNRIREWLLLYNKLLYFTSILTGSSFTAVEIFNSNLFGLNIFYIGLSKQYSLSFTNKKLYSVILLENAPQLLLTAWFMILDGAGFIAFASMTFSSISIIIAIISMILQKKIYRTQDYVYITVDIHGKCVIDNLRTCRNKINGIRKYLSQSVLGVNEKSVEIQKPFAGSVVNGLRLQIHISYIHHNSNINPIDHYKNLLFIAIENGSLVQVIKEEWKLCSLPAIKNIQCDFIKSKLKKALSAARKSNRQNDAKNNEETLHLEDIENMKQKSTDMVEIVEIMPELRTVPSTAL